MGHYDDDPWQITATKLRGRSAHAVILDEYTDKLGDALNAHMAEQYKQSALDELFGVK